MDVLAPQFCILPSYNCHQVMLRTASVSLPPKCFSSLSIHSETLKSVSFLLNALYIYLIKTFVVSFYQHALSADHK